MLDNILKLEETKEKLKDKSKSDEYISDYTEAMECDMAIEGEEDKFKLLEKKLISNGETEYIKELKKIGLLS